MWEITLAILFIGMAGLTIGFILPFAMPLPPGLLAEQKASPVFLDRHGAALMHFALPEATHTAKFGLNEIPKDLINCILAAEDKRFFEHSGVDVAATVRAAWDFIWQRMSFRVHRRSRSS